MLAVLNDFSGQSLAVAQNQRRSVLEDTRGTASPLFQGGVFPHYFPSKINHLESFAQSYFAPWISSAKFPYFARLLSVSISVNNIWKATWPIAHSCFGFCPYDHGDPFFYVYTPPPFKAVYYSYRVYAQRRAVKASLSSPIADGAT